MAILEFYNWQVAIGKSSILSNINFALNQGEVLAIIGESGSGKTTLTRSILGDLPASSTVAGEILFNNKSLYANSLQQWQNIRGSEITYMAQNPMSVFNYMQTIGEHAYEFMASHKKLSRSEIYAQIITALSQCNLRNPEDLLRRYPFELSGGMLQRVMMAILLGLNPQLYIADEPTSALDEFNSQIIIESLLQLKAQGIAMIIVTHDYEILESLADKIMILKNGAILEYNYTSTLLQNPQTDYAKQLLAKPHQQHYLFDTALMDTEGR